MFKHTLKNGKTVEYHEDYRVDGVIILVKTKLTEPEKKELYKHFQFERDLVNMDFDCTCAAYCS